MKLAHRFIAAMLFVLLVSISFLPISAQASGWIKVGNTVTNGDENIDIEIINLGSAVYVSYVWRTYDQDVTYVCELVGSKWIDVGYPLFFERGKLLTDGKKLYVGGEKDLYRFSDGQWRRLSKSGMPSNLDSYEILHWMVYNGTPYVVYGTLGKDFMLSGIYVKKFNGSRWVGVGGRISVASPGQLSETASLQMYKGSLYLSVFTTNSVLKFNGSKWITVGKNVTGSDSVMVGASDALYMASLPGVMGWDMDGYTTIKVDKYVSGKWRTQGSRLKTTKGNFGIMTNKNTLYAFHDYLGRLYNKKLVGSKWTDISSSLAIKNSMWVASACVVNGVLYTAYVDNSNDLVVRKFK
jgi:hypothetical protein